MVFQITVVAGGFLAIVGFLITWAALMWLIVISFRKGEIRPPIAGVLTGVAIASVGGFLFFLILLFGLAKVVFR